MKKVFLLITTVVLAALIVACGNDIDSNDCEHEYGEWITVKNASCIAEGIRERTCKLCGSTESQSLETTSHTEVVDEAVAPTCQTNGYTAGAHCSICNYVLKAQEIIPAAHDYDDGVVSTKATCGVEGVKTFTCRVCGKVRNDVIPKTYDHSYVTEIVKVATCTEDGLKKMICQICGYVSRESIAKFGHSFGEGKETVAATCEKSGEKVYVCQVCNYIKTDYVSPLGHKPNANFVCTVCGKQCPITLNMTASEKTNAYKVRYLSERQIWHQDDEKRYVLVFALEDSNKEMISAPCVVDITIVNDDGLTVYEATKMVKSSDFSTWSYSNGAVKKYQGAIYIYDSEIKEGAIDDGDIFFTIYNDGYFTFPESSLSIDDLPKKQIKVKLPSLPVTLDYRSYAAFKMTSLSYEVNNNGNIVFTFSGEKTRGSDGESIWFVWKLLDEKGYVVCHGGEFVSNLNVGEKFRGETFTAYSWELPKGCTDYTLVLEDYK